MMHAITSGGATGRQGPHDQKRARIRAVENLAGAAGGPRAPLCVAVDNAARACAAALSRGAFELRAPLAYPLAQDFAGSQVASKARRAHDRVLAVGTAATPSGSAA